MNLKKAHAIFDLSSPIQREDLKKAKGFDMFDKNKTYYALECILDNSGDLILVVFFQSGTKSISMDVEKKENWLPYSLTIS